MQKQQLDQLAINTLRVHSVEMIEKANSGHPGTPLGVAPVVWALYNNVMKHNPRHPYWIDRDRFVLSAGHASALLYSVLNLFGYPISREDLANFRQWGSPTAGHPEISTIGVEAGTGPLGQGIAMGVGMALAERILADNFNTDKEKLIDHYTYVLHGDGCIQEGVASEACSFAGTQKLHKLITIYDRNQITIDGNIDLTFREDVRKRYEAYGWQVLELADANDVEGFLKLIDAAKADKEHPSLIIVNSVIGFGSPVAGSNKAHGAPLGKLNLENTKKALQWPLDAEDFATDPELEQYIAEKQKSLQQADDAWQMRFVNWRKENPELKDKWQKFFFPDFDQVAADPAFREIPEKAEASRNSSHRALNVLARHLPNLIGGSADLAGSNKSWLEDKGMICSEQKAGQNINYGIREFAMSCIMNGLALHGGLRPYCATFFTFSDYMRSGIRSSALMNLPVMYVFTHDSIGVGEDGPTHQPIEHLSSFRAMPNILTFRPADYVETAAAYLYGLKSGRPVLLALSRQGLEQITLPAEERHVEKGAYIVRDVEQPEIILIATGSEVSLLTQVQTELAKEGIGSRLVSMPCQELFLEQDPAYQEAVLPSACTKRLACEAGSGQSWYRFVGPQGKVHGIDRFGASAPGDKIFEELGFTVDQLVKEAKEVLAK